MQRSNFSANHPFRAKTDSAPLPLLRPYQRCMCGLCPMCRDNAKWDRIFAKFEVNDYGDKRGLFGSPLSDL